MKVAVISGKGGSGKSSITAALVAQARRVVAVDCDVDASNLPLLFGHEVREQEKFVSGQQIQVDTSACIGCGICAKHCAYHAIQLTDDGVAAIQDLLCEDCGLCVRICPQKAITMTDEAKSLIYTSAFSQGVLVHGDLFPGDDNSGKMIARLRQVADKQMEKLQIPLQILDGPPGIGCPVLSTVTGVDKILIVSEPTLSGISDLKRCYCVAKSFCNDISVVINKCNVNEDNRQSLLDFCSEEKLPVVAEIPFDRCMVEAQLNCQSILTYQPDSEISRILVQAFKRLFL